MFKTTINISYNDFKRLNKTLFFLFLTILLVISFPSTNYAQTLSKVGIQNNRHIYIGENFSSNSIASITLFDKLLYKFKNYNNLFDLKTFLELENHFQNRVVYFSKNDIYGFDTPFKNYSYNTIKLASTAEIILDNNFHYSRNLSFIKEKVLSKDFIETVNRNQFYHSYTYLKNDIQTTEVSILSFQSAEASQYLSGTKIWGGIGFAMFGTLMLLPRSVTKWEEGYIDDAKSNFNRAFTKPPVWDEDNWEINYIGHPYAGSLYYNTIRSQGGTVFHSFLFSVFASTSWEYIYEGVAEQPSIQDLIVTPVVGSILGELIHQATAGMKKNGYNFWEAAFVTIFNPMEVIQNGYK